VKLEDLQRYALQNGFFFPTAQVYPDSPAGFWDYGPLGTLLKNRFIELWRRELVRNGNMWEIDGSQILPRKVFVASGHLEGFTEPVTRCAKCDAYFRVDHLLAEMGITRYSEKSSIEGVREEMERVDLRCPSCGAPLREVFPFNTMFRLSISPRGEEAYLRPETCQTIFIDFPILSKTLGVRLPLGIAQVGKSFRNEISPRQGLLRLREFYQAEIETFFLPSSQDVPGFERYADTILPLYSRGEGEDRIQRVTVREAVSRGMIPHPLFAYHLALIVNFYEKAGIDMGRCRFRILDEVERAFYSELAFDFEVQTDVGWIELVACNYRGQYDLSRHSQVSGQSFTIFHGGERHIPHVFELSMGVDRSLYAILDHNLTVDEKGPTLRIKPYLAPIQVAIFPLVARDGLPERAEAIRQQLVRDFDLYYDESGSIGKRYRKADSIGVPVCITVDYDTLRDGSVTIRDRDTKEQVRVMPSELKSRLQQILAYPA
jgi:glycyl-tRNA synthetase